MIDHLQPRFGLKWNPCTPDVPSGALYADARVDNFCERVSHLMIKGGFAMVCGDPGTGKSAALRILCHRLEEQRDVTVGMITRPQASLSDFYREIGAVFRVNLRPSNRWGGSKLLRESWLDYFKSSTSRPVLIIDEAQEMKPVVLSELRLLASFDLDSCALLTIVLAGDGRLVERLRTEEFLPLDSRIRVRLKLERADTDTLRACLDHLLTEAGAPTLFDREVIESLVDHAAGNLRSLMIMADELITAAAVRNAPQIDAKLYFEVYDRKPHANRTAVNNTAKKTMANSRRRQ